MGVMGDTRAIKTEQRRENIHTHITIDTSTTVVFATKNGRTHNIRAY